MLLNESSSWHGEGGNWFVFNARIIQALIIYGTCTKGIVFFYFPGIV